MAETIAVGASVIAIIQIADRIISLCKFYVETARDAPSDLRAILIETSTLKTILENLNFLTACDGPDSAAAQQIAGADGPIEGCFRTLTELEKLFPSDSIGTRGRKGSKKRRLNLVLTALAWPLKKSKARKLLDEMMRYKATIILALTTNSMYLLSFLLPNFHRLPRPFLDVLRMIYGWIGTKFIYSQDIKEVKKKALEIHDMMTESQRREVYQWLQHTDPSPLHHRVQKNYEPGTGNWILRTPEWADWLAGLHRCLWIHGIPGAGKTVLMSYLIEQIGKFCDQNSDRKSICVYYYCYFAHNQDEAKPFLKWLVSRLCRETGHVPTYVYNLSKHGTEPSLTALSEAVAQMLVSFETVYIAIDAIDESRSHDDLLQILRNLATNPKFKGLQLVISSREYIDIERTMSSFSVSISMNNSFVEQDIRLHVHSNLESNPNFGRWPGDLLNEVEERIATGARGMFRWAVCQIDSLQRLKCERKIIQTALERLPKTLDETYERIFLDVPEEERLFVYHALRWIAYDNELYGRDGIPCEVLIEATEASTLSLTGIQNERFYDKDALRQVCGCLIDISPEDMFSAEGDRHTRVSVSFAHYSVREYLDSDRPSNAVFGNPTVRREDPKDRFLEITLTEAQHIESNELWDLEPDLEDDLDVIQAVESNFNIYCVMSALRSLQTFPSQTCQHSTLSALAIDLSNPSMRHFPTMKAAAFKIGRATEFIFDQNVFKEDCFWTIEWHPDTNTELQHLCNLLLLTISCCESLPLVEKFLEGKDVKSLLQAPLCFHKEFEVYADGDYETYRIAGSIIEVFAQLALQSADPFKFLVELGAGFFDPSITLLLYISGHIHSQYDCDGFCPLQRLLELGADPNLRGYQVTPLQIATFCSDYEGVEMLLKAGAMSNDTGSPDGVNWREDSVMHRLNHLHGASPLRICRDFAIITRPTWRQVGADDRKKIEALLLCHGAKAFSTVPGLDVQE